MPLLIFGDEAAATSDQADLIRTNVYLVNELGSILMYTSIVLLAIGAIVLGCGLYVIIQSRKQRVNEDQYHTL